MRGRRRAEWLRRAGIAEEPTAVVPHGGVSEGAGPARAGSRSTRNQDQNAHIRARFG